MKKIYLNNQISKVVDNYKRRVLAESLSSTVENNLKEAAHHFAKWFGKQMKEGHVVKIDDGDDDALSSIKKTIKVNSSVKLSKQEAKRIGIPDYMLDKVAEMSVKAFISNVFNGSKKLVDNLVEAINLIDRNYSTTEEYLAALQEAIYNQQNKKLQNLKKTTEQFNFFANEVFMVWKRDSEIREILKNIPEFPVNDNKGEKVDNGEGDSEELSEQEFVNGKSKASKAFLKHKKSKKKSVKSDDDFEDLEDDSEEDFEEPDEDFEGDSEEDFEEPDEDFEEPDEDFEGDSEEDEDSEVKNTVGDLIKILKSKCDSNDDLIIKIKKCDSDSKSDSFIYNIKSSKGKCVIDVVENC